MFVKTLKGIVKTKIDFCPQHTELARLFPHNEDWRGCESL